MPAVEAWQMWTRAPASRASSASRATMDSSAARGQPARLPKAHGGYGDMAVGPVLLDQSASLAAEAPVVRVQPDQRVRIEHDHLSASQSPVSIGSMMSPRILI